MSRTTWSRKCALTASTTTSCLPASARVVDRFHLCGFDFAVMPFELDAVLLDRGEMRALVDDRHMLARERELCRHQAADRAGADDADAACGFGAPPRR